MKNSGNTILITGGSSGFGREYARAWHDAGNTVIVAARSADELEETAKGRENLHAMPLDVADAAAVEQFAKEIVERFPDLNIVMNNAGIMPYEDITGARDLSDAEKVIAINVLGPIRLTDALIDHLKAQDDAVLINVTSGLAYVPMPKAATYSATKAAVRAKSHAGGNSGRARQGFPVCREGWHGERESGHAGEAVGPINSSGFRSSANEKGRASIAEARPFYLIEAGSQAMPGSSRSPAIVFIDF